MIAVFGARPNEGLQGACFDVLCYSDPNRGLRDQACPDTSSIVISPLRLVFDDSVAIRCLRIQLPGGFNFRAVLHGAGSPSDRIACPCT